MHAQEQNHNLSQCFNTNNILLLYWAFSVLQQKIQQQIFVFDINRCCLSAPVVALRGCNTKRCWRRECSGQLMSVHCSLPPIVVSFSFMGFFSSESVCYLLNHLYQYEILSALPFIPSSISAVNLTHCLYYDSCPSWL